MASKNIEDLIPEMQDKVKFIIDDCKNAGFDLLIYCTYRSLEEQARLFRQGRSSEEIEDKISRMTNAGFKFLADIIEEVGPQSENKKVTWVGPGESWHNYKEAFDAVPMVAGKALWNDNEKYNIYGQSVQKHELEWGGSWKRLIDKPHTQFRIGSNPLKIYKPEEIFELFEKIKN